MKKYISLLIIVFMLLVLEACINDNWCGQDCSPHGGCNPADGKCICFLGYEQDVNGVCNIRSRLKFLSFREDNVPYLCFDSCQNTNTTPYQVMIMPDKTPTIIDKIYIRNFRNKGDSAIAQLALSSTFITLANQIINGDSIVGKKGIFHS